MRRGIRKAKAMRTMKCQHCKEYFSVVATRVGGRPTLQPIHCPYCREVWAHEESGGEFLTIPVVAEM